MSLYANKTFRSTAGILCSILTIFLTGTLVADEKVTDEKVTVKAAVSFVDKKTDQLEVEITIDIQDGWHIYAELPKDHPSILTKIEIVSPKGIKETGDMVRPETVPDKNELGVSYFEGEAVFKQKLKIEKKPADGTQIEVKVRYQACTDKMCQPPKTKTIKLDLPKPKANK